MNQQKYIANDGQEFQNEYECEKHNEQLENKKDYESIKGRYLLFDCYMNPLDEVTDDVVFLKADSVETCDVLQRIFERKALESPWDYRCSKRAGCWHLDTDECHWSSLDYEWEDFKEELEQWKKILKALGLSHYIETI